MTVHRPENLTAQQWMMQGVNLKTILVYTVGLCGLYAAMGSRVTAVETEQKASARENDQRFSEVSKTYELDQRRVADELSAIRESQGRVEEILMERPQR